MAVPEITTAHIISLLSGGTIVALIGWLANRKKMNADTRLSNVKAETEMASSALSYAAMLRQELNTMKNDISQMSTRAKNFEKYIIALEAHILLQFSYTAKLREALKGYNPDHPLLKEVMPKPPELSI